MKRVVYTLAVGKPKYAECALGLGRSLKLIGDTTHRIVVTDLPDFPWEKSFDEVLTPTDPLDWVMFSKLRALERTDADQVLFIDGDSLVFKRLDPIFDYCSGRGFCVQGVTINQGQWFGNVADHLKKYGVSELPRFNGGMIYYERTPKCQTVIEACYEAARNSKDSGFICDTPWIPDEPAFSVVMALAGLDTGAAHVIPETMDFMNTATGLIGKLELDVMRNQCSFLCRRYDIRHVRPTIFHAARYINFAVYWKQLERLAWLEKYESEHSFGYMSPWQKLERSANRRYLKYIKKVL